MDYYIKYTNDPEKCRYFYDNCLSDYVNYIYNDDNPMTQKHYLYNIMTVLDTGKILPTLEKHDNNRKCKQCKGIMTRIDKGQYQCEYCLLAKDDNSEKYSLREKKNNNNLMTYNKKIFFEEHLNILTMTKIPKKADDTLKSIEEYIKQYNIDVKSINNKIMQNILKNLKLSKLYKFKSYFRYKIQKLEIKTVITSVDKAFIYELFSEVVTAWELLIKKNDKKSFNSFPYILRKIIELIGRFDDYLPLMDLKNSDENMDKNNNDWKIICDYLGWEFIPSY